MKRINIFYWIFTILFAAMMLFSAYPDIMVNEQAVKMMHDVLGYPLYLISFIGIAKLLGVIAILIPGFRILKEWAYAGLVFDLIGATYSIIAVTGVSGGVAFMLLPFALFAGSYIFYHKKLKAEGAKAL